MAGEDFGKVAGEVSESASKANGGLIGPFSHDDMSPQMQELLDKMKPGDITPADPHAARLSDPQARNAEGADRPAVRQGPRSDRRQGRTERTRNEMRKFLTRLRAQAIIEWKNDELKKAYEKQVAADDAAVSASQ